MASWAHSKQQKHMYREVWNHSIWQVKYTDWARYYHEFDWLRKIYSAPMLHSRQDIEAMHSTKVELRFSFRSGWPNLSLYYRDASRDPMPGMEWPAFISRNNINLAHRYSPVCHYPLVPPIGITRFWSEKENFFTPRTLVITFLLLSGPHMRWLTEARSIRTGFRQDIEGWFVLITAGLTRSGYGIFWTLPTHVPALQFSWRSPSINMQQGLIPPRQCWTSLLPRRN